MSLINNRKSLIIAFTFGALAFVIVGSIALKNPKKEQVKAPVYQYVVLKESVKKGDEIKEENVEIKEFPINIEGAQKATGEVIGRKADTEIEKGQPVVKGFLQTIKSEAVYQEPRKGFRAVPVVIKKSNLPSYVKKSSKFDLYVKSNSMRIENLTILDILDQTNDSVSKVLVLEIKKSDVMAFLEHASEKLIFVQKNKEDYGEYRFSSINSPSYSYSGPSKAPVDSYIPPIGDFLGEVKQKKEVEVIVGSTKSKMEFEN